MSSAHYFVRNYNIRQVLDLMCYETQFPHTLTSTQKITRMYRCLRCLLRREKQITLNENRGCQQDFYNNVYSFRQRLLPLFNISESSAQFKQTLEFYEQRVRDNMDPTMLINPCRPYSATSGKYYIFSNKDLSYDPFGYYSGRIVGHREPSEGFIYYPDYPHDGNVWHINPPMEYDDDFDTKDFKSTQ